MNNPDVPTDDTEPIVALQDNDQERAYFTGMAMGCFGCFGTVVLSVIGFVTGYSLVGLAHENQWFYTKEEFINSHGLSDAGLVAFGNLVLGGFIGAVLLPVAVVATLAFLRKYKNRRRK
jgi:hypothetical protein